MRPAWRLAISSAFARRSRTMLLVGAVALSAALVTAVATATRSLNASVELRTEVVIGKADIRVEPSGSGQTMPADFADIVRTWPEVRVAAPRLESSLTALALRKPILIEQPDGSFAPRERVFVAGAMGNGITLDETSVRPLPLIAGRLPERDNEVAIDALLAARLGWEWSTDDERRYGFSIVERSMIESRLGPLEPPASVGDARAARRWNLQQGVRLEDQLTVVPSFVAPDSRERIAREVLGAMGYYPINDGLRLMGDAARIALLGSDIYRISGALRSPTMLKVVGIVEQPPLGGRAQAYLTLPTLQRLTRQPGMISRVDVLVRERADPQAVVDAHAGEVPESIIMQTTARITSGLRNSIESSQLGFLLISFLALIAAAFIITTGLTTDLAQRQRELAILRCVGGRRAQLVESQVATGLIVGLTGSLIGVPLGLFMSWVLAVKYPEEVPAGLVISPTGIAAAFATAAGAGLIGALWPAVRAARAKPLDGLRARVRPARARGIALTGVIGVALALSHLAIVSLPTESQILLWLYLLIALPCMFLGYFLLGVPLVAVACRTIAPLYSRLARLPRGLLGQSVLATPYRHGFTAGAMMAGLALIVVIWTNGGSILRDWVMAMEFPDAFVSGIPLDSEAVGVVNDLPFVENSSVITREIVHPVDDAAIRVGDFEYDTTFIGFDPDAFFAMTSPTWVEGSLEAALPRLRDGTGVLIAREFHVARGLGVGDPFACEFKGTRLDFEIVGVVTSPGLDIASRFFNIGEEYTHQAVHSVFGSLAALRKLGSDRVHLIQIDLDDEVDDAEAIAELRRVLTPYGLLDAGSGRQIKDEIVRLARGTIFVFSMVAVVSMLIACFGVANLIVAAIETRRFEFGVLRAVGARRGLLVRLVLGEAVIIAAVASVLGTTMGLQASLGSQRIYAMILGIEFTVRPAIVPILIGAGTVFVLTLGAAVPAVWRLSRRHPRELLSAV